MAFIAVYDANVLYPNTLRDLLIRIAQLPHLVQAKWTEEILDEVADALRKNFPDISPDKTDRLRERMNAAAVFHALWSMGPAKLAPLAAKGITLATSHLSPSPRGQPFTAGREQL